MIDYCEDVAPLSMEDAAQIKALFQAAGANARISAIHVNGWFGDYDKPGIMEKPLDEIGEDVLYSGDLPNRITVKPGGLGFVEMVNELLR